MAVCDTAWGWAKKSFMSTRYWVMLSVLAFFSARLSVLWLISNEMK